MLLQEGMYLKVLLLPNGDDPDSFARKNTAESFRRYIAEHETDFIEFKTRLLTDGTDDPQKRSATINSIVNSIAYVQDPVLRDTYIHECAERMHISESTLISQMNNYIRSGREADQRREQRQQENAAQELLQQDPHEKTEPQVEQLMIKLVIQKGEQVIYPAVEVAEGDVRDFNVAQYFAASLGADGLLFHNPLYNRILQEAVDHSADPGFKAEPYFIHHADLDISRIADDVSVDRYQMADKKEEGRESDRFLDEEAKREAEMQKTRQLADHLLLDFGSTTWRPTGELQQQISLPGQSRNSSRDSWPNTATCRPHATR